MPVQIDEVVITTTVNPRGGEMQSPDAVPDLSGTADYQRELAEKILQIIREKSER